MSDSTITTTLFIRVTRAGSEWYLFSSECSCICVFFFRGTIDNNDPEDGYDCESEGYENMMEEMAPKSNYNRNFSKRTRAAEVHNMSEKRRRNRINEKMKTLQKLIPNSNKMDKASMLDEAIEYLKQLQLRVQLTMRNGINLYSMSVPPEVLQPHQLPHSRIGLNEPANMVSLNQETHVNLMLNLLIQCTNRNQLSIPDFSHIINPGPLSSSWECLINSNELMNSQQNLVHSVVLDGVAPEMDLMRMQRGEGHFPPWI